MPTTPTPSPRSRPAVFLDRDGTLVEEVPYLHDPAEVALLPGVAGAAGYALVVATNQAGVARGYHDEAAVARVHRRLRALLTAGGARLDAVLYCPHHPDGTVAGHARACRCRKPAPGMLQAAAGRGGGVPEPGGGRCRPPGTERARPASAVTGRAWPGCRLVAGDPRPGRHLQRSGRVAPRNTVPTAAASSSDPFPAGSSSISAGTSPEGRCPR